MTPRSILAIDVGTTATKILETTNGEITHTGRAASTGLDVPSWMAAIRQFMESRRSPLTPDVVVLTGQMHGLMLQEHGELRSAGSWADLSSAAEATAELSALRGQLGDESAMCLGGPVQPGFQIERLNALLADDPARARSIQRIFLPKDALAYALTGAHVTDPGDAAGSGLYAPMNGDWWEPALRAAHVDPAWISEIRRSGEIIGSITAEAATATGIPEGTPVALGSGDAIAAAVGADCVRPGDALIVLGTGAQVVLPSLEFDPDPVGCWYAWPVGGDDTSLRDRWLRVGTLTNGGNAIAWANEHFGAPHCSIGGPSPLLALPWLLPSRPPFGGPSGVRFSDPEAPPHDRFNAIVLGVIYSLRYVFETMTAARPDAGSRPALLHVAGGLATRSMAQLLAEVFAMPVARFQNADMSAVGAARFVDQTLPVPTNRIHPINPTPFERQYREWRAFARAKGALS